MGKKFWIGVGIVFACALLFVVGCVLIMFLAPGVELFGIRYVAPNQGVYEFNEAVESFSGDVYIEIDEVPITISYPYSSAARIHYKQDFVGFTRTQAKTAYLEYTIESNDLHIKAYDLKKFVYARPSVDGSDCFLNITLPNSFVGKNLYIKASSSNVTLEGNTSLHNIIDIKTSGIVNFNNNVYANQLKIETGKMLSIDSNVVCNDINIVGGNNDIKILGERAGSVNIETSGGNLYMKTIENLTFKSSSGSLKALDENGTTITSANIETYSGNILVSKLLGSGEHTLKSTVGNATIGEANGTLNITVPRGAIKINSAETANVTGGIGVVEIKEIQTQAHIETRNGYIYVGEKDTNKVRNITASSQTGKIFVYGVSGIVDLESTNNAIELVANSVTNVRVVSGSSVTATGLAGNVTISANGDVDVTMASINGNTDITTGDRSRSVVFRMANTELSSVNYHFKSTKSSAVAIYSGTTLVEDNRSDVQSPDTSNPYNISIQTSYARQYIYAK